MLMDFICDCTDIYFDALDGNEVAANQLNLNAFISTAGFLSQPLVEPLAEGLASVKAPECVSNAVNAGNDWILGNSETYRRFVMMGYSDELVAGLFQDARCFLYGDDFIENVLKSGDAHGIMSTLANCPDEIISVVNSSTMKEVLPSFISDYGDDATKILMNYGDDGLEIVEKSLNKDVAVSKLNGNGKAFTLGVKSDAYPNRSNYNVSDRINHSNIGDYSAYKEPNNPSRGGGNIKSGCHGQDGMDELTRRGINYNIEITYENGVRAGNIPSINSAEKSTGIGQAWFPSTWTASDIEAAGIKVMQDRSVVIAYVYDGKITGYEVYGVYNGVTVGVITDANGEMTSKIGTIFPDNLQRSLGDF